MEGREPVGYKSMGWSKHDGVDERQSEIVSTTGRRIHNQRNIEHHVYRHRFFYLCFVFVHAIVFIFIYLVLSICSMSYAIDNNKRIYILCYSATIFLVRMQNVWPQRYSRLYIYILIQGCEPFYTIQVESKVRQLRNFFCVFFVFVKEDVWVIGLFRM